MKVQTGIRIDAEAWQAYRALCSREHLHPSTPIEEFLKTAVDKGSTLEILGLVRSAAKSQAEGINANARVLLNWYLKGKHFFHTLGQDNVPVEGLLLEALKTVTDSELRRQIEEALIAK